MSDHDEATVLSPHVITKQVQDELAGTRYACRKLTPLSGGTANFTYQGELERSLDNGTSSVFIKHGEGYVASVPGFALSTDRCRFEVSCLKAMSLMPAVQNDVCTIRTPKILHASDDNRTHVTELAPNAHNLKAYCLEEYAAGSPGLDEKQCHEIGRAMGVWLRQFHGFANNPAPRGFREELMANEAMQQLKFNINYPRLLQRTKSFPDVLSDATRLFEEVIAMAKAELENESQLQVIHGDFWTGNILLTHRPPAQQDRMPMFVIDWELAQLGVPALDLGQMIAELYELFLFKELRQGLWIIKGFVAGYGMNEELAYRTAIHVGAHLVCWGTSVPGWGTPKQVETVARVGKELIRHAWDHDRAWFEHSDLAFLFNDSQNSHAT